MFFSGDYERIAASLLPIGMLDYYSLIVFVVLLYIDLFPHSCCDHCNKASWRII